MPRRDASDAWARHAGEWRDPAQVVAMWGGASALDRRLLDAKADRGWWSLIEELGITLFVTREYEHLVIAMSARGGRPLVTFLPIPHPSGLVVDRARRVMHLASTRNPNQVVTLRIAQGALKRGDVAPRRPDRVRIGSFVPVASAIYPGSLYIHDLALIGGKLHANAVGHNAVVALGEGGRFRRVWWPKCVERGGRPAFDRNYIQLNSIAPGRTVRSSYYSASSALIGRRRPGDLEYKVDRQGVVFSGATREPICGGLTRPHSVRQWNGKVWVANSGYGEIGIVDANRFEPVQRFEGWTRGLCLVADVAFVATSRVIPRYARYAPGLDCTRSICGVHAVCTKTGRLLGSITWPSGNQVFAMDWIADTASQGLVFNSAGRDLADDTAFFYGFLTTPESEARR